MGVASPKHASHEVTVVHHAAAVADNAVYREVDRARGKRDALTLSQAPNDNAPRRLFAVVVRGLPVSLRSFLQNLHVESLFGHHLLQPSILILQRLELLGHFRQPAAVLLPSAVIRLFCDPNQLTNFRNFLAFAKLHIRSTQLGDNLVHTMTFLCYLKESFPGLQPDRILSLFLDQF